jgi:hypothetical protein
LIISIAAFFFCHYAIMLPFTPCHAIILFRFRHFAERRCHHIFICFLIFRHAMPFRFGFHAISAITPFRRFSATPDITLSALSSMPLFFFAIAFFFISLIFHAFITLSLSFSSLFSPAAAMCRARAAARGAWRFVCAENADAQRQNAMMRAGASGKR